MHIVSKDVETYEPAFPIKYELFGTHNFMEIKQGI